MRFLKEQLHRDAILGGDPNPAAHLNVRQLHQRTGGARFPADDYPSGLDTSADDVDGYDSDTPPIDLLPDYVPSDSDGVGVAPAERCHDGISDIPADCPSPVHSLEEWAVPAPHCDSGTNSDDDSDTSAGEEYSGQGISLRDADFGEGSDEDDAMQLSSEDEEEQSTMSQLAQFHQHLRDTVRDMDDLNEVYVSEAFLASQPREVRKRFYEIMM